MTDLEIMGLISMFLLANLITFIIGVGVGARAMQ